MTRVPCAARGDDGDLCRRLDLGDELQVEPAVGAVLVDAVEQDLTGAHGLDGLHELDDVHVARLAAALDGARVPAVAFTLGAGGAGLDDVVARGIDLGHVDALGVDADDNGLVAVGARDLLDGGVAEELLAERVVLLGGEDGVGANGDLVGAGLEVHGGDFQGRDLGAVRVDRVADAAAYRERHKDRLGGLAQDFEHGEVGDGAVAEGRDVEERHLVRALFVVLLGHLDRLAEVAHVAVVALFADVVLVALGDDEVTLVVCPHVQAGDDAAGEAVAELDVGHVDAGLAAQGLCALARQKGADGPEPCHAGFLRVELRAKDVPLGDGANEGLAAVGARGDRPALGLDLALGVGRLVGVDVVVLGVGAKVVHGPAAGVGAVPPDVRDGLVGVVEALERGLDQPQARDPWVLLGALKESLQADAYAHEGLAGLYVLLYCRQVVCLGEL